MVGIHLLFIEVFFLMFFSATYQPTFGRYNSGKILAQNGVASFGPTNMISQGSENKGFLFRHIGVFHFIMVVLWLIVRQRIGEKVLISRLIGLIFHLKRQLYILYACHWSSLKSFLQFED